MKEPYLNEVHHLLPHIRDNMITGVQRYSDQEQEVALEDHHQQRLVKSGEVKFMGGERSPRLRKTLVSNTIRREISELKRLKKEGK